MPKINTYNKILYLLFSLSLFLGFFLNEDTAGHGQSVIDFNDTWPAIADPFKYFEIQHGIHNYIDFKFPLHYYLSSIIYKIVENQNYFRIIFITISLTVPYIFYQCLRKKFSSLNPNNLFLFSLIIFLLPSFRTAAIWPNSQITALIFFLFSLYYYIVWKNKKNFLTLDKNIILSLIFISLAVYSRQLYAIIYLYYLFDIYLKSKLNFLFKILFITFIFSIPGLYIVFFKNLETATLLFNNRFYNSLLINPSILFFYLLPFFTILIINNSMSLKIDFIKDLIYSLIVFLGIFLCFHYFDYNVKIGGGFFLKLSLIFFDNLYFFLLTTFLGYFFIYKLCKENLNNIFIFSVLIIIFTSKYIMMKYFEPMFLIVLFILVQTKTTEIFISKTKNINLYFFYFIIYFFSALGNDFFNITENFIGIIRMY